MAINYAQIYSNVTEIMLSETPLTSILNSDKIKTAGGDKVNIPIVKANNLVNYDRAAGYKQGAASIDWVTYELRYDRDMSFRIDAQDLDETGFELSAQAVLEVKNKEVIAPEIDCVRLSTLFQATNPGTTNKTIAKAPDKTTVIDYISTAISEIRNESTSTMNPILFIDMLTWNALKQTGYSLEKGQIQNGSIVIDVHTFDGCPIIPIPTSRMMSAYDIDNLGCKPQAEAKQVYVIAVAPGASHGITKLEEYRLITPQMNALANAYDLNGRCYYDLFVLEQYKHLIRSISAV